MNVYVCQRYESQHVALGNILAHPGTSFSGSAGLQVWCWDWSTSTGSEGAAGCSRITDACTTRSRAEFHFHCGAGGSGHRRLYRRLHLLLLYQAAIRGLGDEFSRSKGGADRTDVQLGGSAGRGTLPR